MPEENCLFEGFAQCCPWPAWPLWAEENVPRWKTSQWWLELSSPVSRSGEAGVTSCLSMPAMVSWQLNLVFSHFAFTFPRRDLHQGWPHWWGRRLGQLLPLGLHHGQARLYSLHVQRWRVLRVQVRDNSQTRWCFCNDKRFSNWDSWDWVLSKNVLTCSDQTTGSWETVKLTLVVQL